MITDFDFPTYYAPFAASRAASTTRHVLRSHSQSSHSSQSRAEHEAQFEREHGSLWTPGLLDRLSLPLTRFHE